MKSNCCQANIFVVGDETKHYRCERCQQACDAVAIFHYTVKHVEPCIRCDKMTDKVHTCTPTKQYRAGIVGGLEMAREEVVKGLFTEPVCISDIVKEIDKLIKQHTGDE